MLLKEIKTELVDKQSRFVLKRIITSEGDWLNRRLAISNFFHNCEKIREIWKKPMFSSLFQTHHIRFNKYKRFWDFDNFEEAKSHAVKQGRFFIPYRQRNKDQHEKLTWQEAENDFEDLLNRGVSIVPYPIPIGADIKTWSKRKRDALSIMNKSQRLMPTFSSKHRFDLFPLILKEEMVGNNLIGINCYQLGKDPTEIYNLSALRLLNIRTKTGDNSPLIFCFDFPRMLSNHSNVAGSFAFSCFAGDVFSEKVCFVEGMSKEAIEKMMKRSPEKFFLYDTEQKGFNKSLNQKDWYGFELTRKFMSTVSVNEGLTGYQAMRWRNHEYQQKDLDLINNILLSKEVNLIEQLNQHSRWGVFWDRTVAPSLRIVNSKRQLTKPD